MMLLGHSHQAPVWLTRWNEAWFQHGCVKVMTYAPERDPDNVLPEIARAHGVKLQIGHSGAIIIRRLNYLVVVLESHIYSTRCQACIIEILVLQRFQPLSTLRLSAMTCM